VIFRWLDIKLVALRILDQRVKETEVSWFQILIFTGRATVMRCFRRTDVFDCDLMRLAAMR